MFLDYVMIHPSKKLTWNLKSFLLKRQIILQTFNLWVQNVKFQARIPFFYVDVLSQTPQQKSTAVKGEKKYTHPTFFFCDVGPTPRRVFQATTFGGFNQHVPWVCRHVVYEGFHMIPEFCCEQNTTYTHTHMIVYIINIYACIRTSRTEFPSRWWVGKKKIQPFWNKTRVSKW